VTWYSTVVLYQTIHTFVAWPDLVCLIFLPKLQAWPGLFRWLYTS